MLVMLLPLPAALARIGGTVRAAQNQQVVETLAAVRQTGIPLAATPLFSLTRSRAGSLRLLLLMITAYAGWGIIRQSTARQRGIWLHLFVLLAAVMGLAGIVGIRLYPQGDTLWWLIPVPHGRPGPMGGFMNRNHFAGFMAMAAPVALALALHDLRQRRLFRSTVKLAITTALISSVLLSHSRGGLAALVAGLATLLFITTLCGSRRTRLLLPVATAVLVLASLSTISRIPAALEFVSRLRTPLITTGFHERIDAWQGAWRIWRCYPLLGAGPNAFRTVYPQHRLSSARDARDFAENEYVQWGSETGLAGLCLAALFGWHLLRRLIGSLRDAPPDRLAAPTAAAAALAAAAIHALVDFPIRLPLYTLSLAALCGLFWPVPDEATDAAPPPPHLRPHFAAAGLLLALVLTATDIRLDTAGRIGRANLRDVARALTAAPSSPVVWRRLAAHLWQSKPMATRQLAERCLTQAAIYDPNDYPLWLRLGNMRRELGDSRGALAAYRRVKALRDWVPVPLVPEEE